jgi:hypothetical protein
MQWKAYIPVPGAVLTVSMWWGAWGRGCAPKNSGWSAQASRQRESVLPRSFLLPPPVIKRHISSTLSDLALSTSGRFEVWIFL